MACVMFSELEAGRATLKEDLGNGGDVDEELRREVSTKHSPVCMFIGVCAALSVFRLYCR